MYKTTTYNNFGVIKEVKKLEDRPYEIIGEIRLIRELEKQIPNLISYNKDTNIAITNEPELLQTVVNNIKGFKNYQFIFI